MDAWVIQESCWAQNRGILCGKIEKCVRKCSDNEVKCILCGNSDHVSLNKNKCDVWRKEMEVIAIMTIKKILREKSLKFIKIYWILRIVFLYWTIMNKLQDNNDIVNRRLTRKRYSTVVKRERERSARW